MTAGASVAPSPSSADPAGRTVFINCPYDDRYKPVFDALVFAIHDCGFVARFGGAQVGGAVRLTKIVEQIDACALSIHDISRVELAGASKKLPRFNMPFEAGLAYARRARDPLSHDLLLIDTRAHRYHQSLSDASGLDIQAYSARQPISVIACVRSFLDGRAPDVPGEDYISGRFLAFRDGLRRLAESHRVTAAELKQWRYARKLQSLMVEWMRVNL
jgi:hypothetical protein